MRLLTTSSIQELTMIALVASMASSVIAAPRYDANRFMASSFRDHKVALQEKNVDAYKHASGFQILEGAQLKLSRTELMQRRSNAEDPFETRPTRRLFVDQQEVSLRLRPRGFTQLRLLSSLGESQKRMDQLAVRTAVSKSLLERYLALLTYVQASESQRIYKQMTSLQANRSGMVRRAAQSGALSASDLLKQRSSMEKLEVKTGEAESLLSNARATLKSLDEQFTDFEAKLEDFITPEMMLKQVSTTAVGDSNIEYAREVSKYAADAVNYDIARDGRLIDYIEFGYRSDFESRLLRDDSRFGISIGINIPGFSSGEFNRADKVRELVKYEIEAKDIERESTLLSKQAKDSLELYAKLHRTLSDSDRSGSAERVRRIAVKSDPLLANSIDLENLEKRLSQLDIFFKAGESYLNYLATSGALASRSHTNFLSRDLKEISQ